MSNDRAVVRDYCIEEFGRLVVLLNEPDTPEARAALELELATVRATFAAAESDADRARRTQAKASYASLRQFFAFAFNRMSPTDRQTLAERALGSGRTLLHEWYRRAHAAPVTVAERES